MLLSDKKIHQRQIENTYICNSPSSIPHPSTNFQGRLMLQSHHPLHKPDRKPWNDMWKHIKKDLAENVNKKKFRWNGLYIYMYWRLKPPFGGRCIGELNSTKIIFLSISGHYLVLKCQNYLIRSTIGAEKWFACFFCCDSSGGKIACVMTMCQIVWSGCRTQLNFESGHNRYQLIHQKKETFCAILLVHSQWELRAPQANRLKLESIEIPY